MKGNLLFQNEIFRYITLNLLIAIAYAIGVKLSLEFATLIGGVASVWFPSAMTLGLIYLIGDRVLLGIFSGSWLAVSLDLLKVNPPLSVFSFILINLGCASGNCLQPLIAKSITNKFVSYKHLFSHVNTVVIYVVAAAFSPAISATLGMTSVCLGGLVSWNRFGISWLTWWLASALAHLIFTPTLLLWQKRVSLNIKHHFSELAFVTLLFVVISWLSFVRSYPLSYLYLPILIWTVLRWGSFFASLLVSIVALLAITSTVKGHGLYYIENSPSESLLLLESFMAVFSLTSLILSAVIDEKNAAQLSLNQTLENLEHLVVDRTIQLEQSELLLKQANLELEKLVNIDGLTQIANRRCFDDRLKIEWERLFREQQPLSLLLFDIDCFKRYNDYYGHQVGDDCLSKIAQSVQKALARPADLLARYGGEEFVAILPNTDLNGAIIVAEQIQLVIANLNIPHQNSDVSDMVTVSLGVTSLMPDLHLSPSILIRQADTALYRAKNQGRNRCVVFCE